MLSRVAGNLYWMARYLERAENTARLINVNTNLLLDLPKNITFGWDSLVTIMGSNQIFFAHHEEANERNVVKFLMGDPNNPSSILNALAQSRENMRTTRDIVSTEAWEQLNDLYLYVKSKATSGLTKRARYDFLHRVILGSQQLVGITAGTMNHDAGYDFMRLGRFLERADMTTRILDVRSASLLAKNPEEDIIAFSPFQNLQWMSVLKSLTAYQAYRQRVRVRVKGEDVLKFLLQDKQFPRSVVFCLNQVENYLQNLPKNDTPLRSLAKLQRRVQDSDTQTVASEGLHKFVDELQIGLTNVHDSIAVGYFGQPPITQSQMQGIA